MSMLTEGCLCQPPTVIHSEITANHLREAKSIANRLGELSLSQLSWSVSYKGWDNLQCLRHVCDTPSHLPEGIAGSNGNLFTGMSVAYVNWA